MFRFGTQKKWIIELDGELFKVLGRQLERIHDLSSIEYDTWYLSDLGDSITRLLIVDGPPKYASFIAKRMIQEEGEFDEPVHIITHWKKKKGPNTTQILVTALPARIYSQYVDRIKRHGELILLVPLYSALFSILRYLNPKSPCGVIFFPR